MLKSDDGTEGDEPLATAEDYLSLEEAALDVMKKRGLRRIQLQDSQDGEVWTSMRTIYDRNFENSPRPSG